MSLNVVLFHYSLVYICTFYLNVLAVVVHYEPNTPCIPSPCGANARCREQNGAGSCTCLPDYFGNPYDGCRPECSLNSDCPSNKACVRNKCVDPCPGVCGQNADCQVVNHLPTCTCRFGFTGDSYRYCSVIQQDRKFERFHFPLRSSQN